MVSSDISDYELKRLQNINENRKLLDQLNITSLRAKLESQKDVKLSQPKIKTIKKKAELPKRASRRLLGLAAEPGYIDDEGNPVNGESTPVKNEIKSESDINFDTYDDNLKFSDALVSQADLSVLISNMTRSSVKSEVKRETESKFLDEDETSKRLMEMSSVFSKPVKVVGARIYSISVHPDPSKVLTAVSSKEGEISLYNINTSASGSDEDQDPGSIFQFLPHKKTVPTVKFSAGNSPHLFTCSYDGSVRKMDLNKQEFSTEFSWNQYNSGRGPLLQCLDTHPTNGDLLYLSTGEGDLVVRDLRTPIVNTTLHSLNHDGKKIGYIHVNPVKDHLIAASSLDRTCKIYDLRKLSNDTDIPTMEVYNLEHKKSVTSGTWSPQGDYLATTCFDDTIKIFETEQLASPRSKIIRHNNQTGRWVTMFKAMWHPNPYMHPNVVIGDMTRSTSIYSKDGKLLTQFKDSELITAIPSVYSYHPNLSSTLVMGNASGYVICLN